MLVSPINVREFLELLHKCKPKAHWHRPWLGQLGVANSGGPDSMCLLYLLVQAVKTYGHESGLPSTIRSIHIDHDLQPANESMRKKVSVLAKSLGIHDMQLVIPWGVAPFPQKPGPGVPFEGVARDVRAHLILRALRKHDVGMVAYGHHADDQVETVLMRLLRGSGQTGASGMRRVRRWGMGSVDTTRLQYAGTDGMALWLLRPLLDIPKDRILATCEANGIDYVTDPSNFQPDATLRNYLRKYLVTMESRHDQEEVNTMGTPKQTVLAAVSLGTSEIRSKELAMPQVASINSAIYKLQSMARTYDLREAVRRTNEAQNRIDALVDRVLLEAAQPKVAPLTWLFNPCALQHIVDPILRMAIIRRILLFVSPLAWGSSAAEAHGSRDSLERIARILWDTSLPPEKRKAFSSGAKVLWSPIMVNLKEKRYLLRPGPLASNALEQPMWLAHRTPPSSHEVNQTVTRIPVSRLKNNDPSSVVWDGRFDLRIDLSKLHQHISLLPTDILSITPTSRWLLPSVHLLTRTGKVLLGEYKDSQGTKRSLGSENHPWIPEYPGSIYCYKLRYISTGAR